MQQVKLHLGCGKIVLDGWLNYDIEKHPGVIRCDLTKNLPHQNKSVDYIFSEHFIEHISKHDAKRLLSECYRVLKPGGAIRIITPNMQVLIDDYCAGKLNRWAEIWQPETLCDMVNEGMRFWGHQYVYDRSDMAKIMIEAGFSDITAWKYKQSNIEAFKGIDQRPHFGEIIMEGLKA